MQIEGTVRPTGDGIGFAAKHGVNWSVVAPNFVGILPVNAVTRLPATS